MTDIFTLPLAITPTAFQEIQALRDRLASGAPLDLAAIEAKLGRPLSNSPPALEVTPEGVAIVTINGIMAPHAGLMMQISGGTSTNTARAEIEQAIADPAVKAIVLSIDSPGGTVAGTEALGNAVYAARGKKPVEAITGGQMGSAAYWVAAQADAIYISGDTTQVGSIGVIATHVDQSKADDAAGVKVTSIVSGPLKDAGNPHRPLDDTGRGVLQSRVDHLHQVFANAVARGRGLSGDALKAVANAKIFNGRQAIDAGLVDGVASLAERVKALGTKSLAGRTHSTARTIMSPGDLVRASRLRQHQAIAAGIVPGFDVLSFISENGGR